MGRFEPGTSCPLSDRETQVIRLLAEGLVYKQIAERLQLAVSTVRSHLVSIYAKLGVNNRAQAILLCTHCGWIDSGFGGPQSREELLLVGIHRTLTDLTQTIRGARTRASITPTQRRYCEAFVRYLRAGADIRTDERRAEMTKQMELVLEEADMSFASLNARKGRQRGAGLRELQPAA